MKKIREEVTGKNYRGDATTPFGVGWLIIDESYDE